jgi:hypothetical protein
MSVISVLMIVLIALLALTVAASIVVAVASFAPFVQRNGAKGRGATFADAADVWVRADQSLLHGNADWREAILRMSSVSLLTERDVEQGIARFARHA